jgi:ABC-type glutathione transport system ATPase component
LWLGLEGICFIGLLVFIDWCHLHPTPRRALQSTAPAVAKPPGWEDEDVLAESGKMPSTKEAAVHVQGARKVYVRSRFSQFSEAWFACCCRSECCAPSVNVKPNKVVNHAVKAVHFAINYGEVFGLLGTNGAGKSTLFNMIAGHFSPNDGSIHVAGLDMATGVGSRSARTRTGYCPQENALLEI